MNTMLYTLNRIKKIVIILLFAALGLAPMESNAIEPKDEEIVAISVIRRALQAKYESLPVVNLNAVKEDVKFEIVDMKKSITTIEGSKYCAFRFNTGNKVSQLVWCFRKPPGLRSWYIFSEKGRMDGFTDFNMFKLSDDGGGMGSIGDLCCVQSLTSRHFSPNTGYIIWFEIRDNADSAINLSLNMTPVPDNSRYSEVFPSITL